MIEEAKYHLDLSDCLDTLDLDAWKLRYTDPMLVLKRVTPSLKT